jgi:hypothetical protein
VEGCVPLKGVRLFSAIAGSSVPSYNSRLPWVSWLERGATNLKVGGAYGVLCGYGQHIKSHSFSKAYNLIEVGLETEISSLGERRLIHWATRATMCLAGRACASYAYGRGFDPHVRLRSCVFARVFHQVSNLGTSTHKHRSVAQVSHKCHAIVTHVCARTCGEEEERAWPQAGMV